MRKVFLEDLPRRGSFIDWGKSIDKRINFIYDDINGYITIKQYYNKKLTIVYNDKEYKILPDNLKKCKLGNILNIFTKEFKIEIGQVFKDDKRDLIIIDREYRKKIKNDRNVLNEKWYKYHCNKCGAELWIIEDVLLKQKCGCSCCRGLTVIKGINDIATTHPHLVKYFVNIEDAYTHTYNSDNYIYAKCIDCGNKKRMRISNLHNKGFNCSACGDGFSYPNKFMFNLLQQLGVKFINEYSPSWINKKRYDFYIPSKKLIIEMDGGFHNKDNNLSGQTAKQSKQIDNYKDKLAEQHDLKVVRIDCDYYDITYRFDFIKNNIINSKLNEIFNLNNINWEKCNKCSNNNIMKNVCNLYNNNKSISEINRLTNISVSCIRSYLKRGEKLNICNYKPKKIETRKIDVYDKNEVYIGTYKNASYIERNSIDLFGIKFTRCNIINVCKGKAKEHKGYIFKFSDKTEETVEE